MRTSNRRSPIYLAVLGVLAGFSLGIAATLAYQERSPKTWAGVTLDPRIMSGAPALPIPTISEIVGGAATDAAARTRIADYYSANAERLADVFNERSDQRTRALFGMYITHLAAPYNTVETAPSTLLEFIAAPAAHCGTYAHAQAQIYNALGLEWQNVIVNGGWHGLIQAKIGQTYEVFDSTSNVWVNQPVQALLDGRSRDYRSFYTPIEDRHAAEQYRDHYTQSGGYYNVLELRAGLPLWGLRVFPTRWEIVEQSGV